MDGRKTFRAPPDADVEARPGEQQTLTVRARTNRGREGGREGGIKRRVM